MPTLYLVDGMSHIYRAYYAIQGLTNKEGLSTNAVFGFTAMLRKLIAEEKPDYLGVAMDLEGPTVRHHQFEDYKATRRPMPEDLVEQLPIILRVCDVFRVPVLTYEGFEADDVIGTLCRKAESQGLTVVIVTIDKDMFQLVSEKTSILDTRTMARYDPSAVKEKWGVSPDQVVDVLSLMGDSSDNIPGAPGIGEKGAKQLIGEFGSLEALFEQRAEISRRSYRESLEQNRGQILQSRELLKIHLGLPIDLDLKMLELAPPDREAACELFRKLNFQSLVEEFLPQPPEGSSVTTGIEHPADLDGLVPHIEGRPVGLFPFLRTTGLNGPELLSVAIEADASNIFLVEGAIVQRNPDALKRLLEAAGPWVVHDLKPFLVWARKQGWRLRGEFSDTMLMAYLLNPNQTDFSFERLVAERLGVRIDAVSSGGLLASEQPAERAQLVARLYSDLMPDLQAHGLEQLLREVETPLVEVLADMESVGVKVNAELLGLMAAELGEEIDSLAGRIFAIADQEFNINSPRQLSEVLFEKLNLPTSRRTGKAGHYSTGVEVLEELAEVYEIAQLILEYRELTKIKSTYLDALPRLINPATGRIHTSYNQMVAATGRLSSSNPNLQNIPIRSETGRKIRRAFIAETGFQILAADYSQIELRVMAHLSGDPVLVEAFNEGEDIHERTAREVFGEVGVLDQIEKRRRAKVINFGIIYGLSAFGLAKSLKINRAEAQRFIDDYFEKYRGVRAWLDRTEKEAAAKGFVTTLFGRIRQVPEINSRNRNLREFARRTAINAPIQGTAADLIKMAMVSIHRRLEREGLESRLILQVHDELVFEVADEEIEVLQRLVREEMEQVYPLEVPLRVDLSVGRSWLEAK